MSENSDNIIPVEKEPEPIEVIPDTIPILPLRNTVMFPVMVLPLTIGREKSKKLVEDAVNSNKFLGLVSQKSIEIEEPTLTDIYHFGTISQILRFIKLPDGSLTIVVQGLTRFKVIEFIQSDPYLKANIEKITSPEEKGKEIEALKINLKQMAIKLLEFSPQLPPEVNIFIQNIKDVGLLIDLITANLAIPVEQKQQILETIPIRERFNLVSKILSRKLEVLELSQKIQSQVKTSMDKTQREYYLREQLKAIQEELGEEDSTKTDVKELKNKLVEAKLPEDVMKEANRELDRLSRMHPSSAEYSVSRTYLEWLTDLPWAKTTTDNVDITGAEKILNEDHYDLEKIKKRILEYLAVRKLKQSPKGPILCFIGPPGVGKTSLGQSIARALGRKFIRMSLGGIRDEAEIRGHRRTYVGALPGRIIQGIRKAGSKNPVFMLDEVDKIGMDFRGDPSSALLEVLDPAQNFSFSDHYLEVPFNLSEVMFITTANITETIPAPLLDRMEVLTLPGYTDEEKLMIAKKYLIPRQIDENGLKPEQIKFTDTAIKTIIASYTKEAGVRNLEREIGAVCRGVARMIAVETQYIASLQIKPDNIAEYLGPVKFIPDIAERTSIPGVATGLAWTPVGGTIIFIEATKMAGKGVLNLTGQMGDVMKESAQAALSYVRSQAKRLNIDEKLFSENDIHIHIPAGAVPKDGPSAGVALFVALISLLTDKTTKSDVAMTGEITLRGLVLPVGGIKEKVLAAVRAGIKTVILPEKNQKDIDEIPEMARKKVKFQFIKKMDEVIPLALNNR